MAGTSGRSLLGTVVEGISGLGMIGFAMLTPFLNPRRRTWGATATEINQVYPGDELVPRVKGAYTHAMTIKAPPASVWPWLVQLGQGRGGFYSYELLENMVGCKIRNADEIIPEFQQLEVGHTIPMHPKMGTPYTVAAIEPLRTLILQIREDTRTGSTFSIDEGYPEKYQNMSWAFVLRERSDGSTRLISRSRNDWDDSPGNTVFYGLFGPVTLMMDRRMLIGIKQRAEGNNKRK